MSQCCCPLNHSQSAVEGLGKLTCIGMGKNIQEYREQSSMASIEIGFCGDFTISETDTSSYKLEVLTKVFTIFSMTVDYVLPPKLQELCLIPARANQTATQLYYKSNIKTDGLIEYR